MGEGLQGKFFLFRRDKGDEWGKQLWTGRISEQLTPEHFFVQIINSPGDGSSHYRIFSIEEMKDMAFFEMEDELYDAYGRLMKKEEKKR